MRNDKEREYYQDARKAYAALMKCYPLGIEDLDGEVWKPIHDYEDYQISNFGRVKSFKQSKAKILKPRCDKKGYLDFVLYKDGKQKSFRAHRLVALTFLPNPEHKPEINHIDGCKMNNCVENLEWATHAENIQHSYDIGLQIQPQGENRYNAKLTNSDVIYIRDNPDNLTTKELIKKFGVVKSQIANIQRGRTYKTAGGSIRGKLEHNRNYVPNEIRAAIRAEYVKQSKDFGSVALAKKYGLNHTTILNIVHETNH